MTGCLHTTRRLSGLPGFPIPREYGRWVRRDDLVRYLEAYAERFAIDVRTGTTVERVKPSGDRWSVQLKDGPEQPARTTRLRTQRYVPLQGAWRRSRSAGPVLHRVRRHAGRDAPTGGDRVARGGPGCPKRAIVTPGGGSLRRRR
jgi:2-polyprenyl-6-methoxyphenol hydroxylase-like FAD-dependent oxidoreductase